MGHPRELLPSLPVYTTFSIRMASPFSPYLHQRRNNVVILLVKACSDGIIPSDTTSSLTCSAYWFTLIVAMCENSQFLSGEFTANTWACSCFGLFSALSLILQIQKHAILYHYDVETPPLTHTQCQDAIRGISVPVLVS